MKRVNQDNEFLRILFVGRSGSGKTRTAYSAALDPRTGPVLGLDARGQPRSIRAYNPQPDILRLEGLQDITAAYRWLKAGQPQNSFAKQWGLNPGEPYRAVVVDGWSEINRWVVLRASGNAGKDAGDDMALTEIKEYGVILAQTLSMVEMFYDLPIHVICTVLEQEYTNIRNQRTYNRLLISGQARDQIASYAEIVGRLTHIEKISAQLREALKNEIDEETTRIAIFKPSASSDNKDQTGCLGDVMVDPTIQKIMDLIEAGSSTLPQGM